MISKRNARGPRTWVPVATVDDAVVAGLDRTLFCPSAIEEDLLEIRTPDRQAVPLLRAQKVAGKGWSLSAVARRPARRSEHMVEESANAYLKLGVANLVDVEPQERFAELLRLLQNASRHVAGAEGGRARPQLREMRGPAMRGGLPSLGKRHR